MLSSTNLASWFRGSGQARELKETRAAWEAAEAIWRASPLAQTDPDGLASVLTKEVIWSTERRPVLPILLACAEAYYNLSRAESIGPIEPKWDAIAASVDVASEFRQLLPRRRRWAADFDTMHGAWKRIVIAATQRLFEVLPESCFGTMDLEKQDSFEVPVLDLLDDPAAIVQHLFLVPYDDETFRLDLFHQLRELCATNMLIASGFTPDTDLREVQHKLVGPQKQ